MSVSAAAGVKTAGAFGAVWDRPSEGASDAYTAQGQDAERDRSDLQLAHLKCYFTRGLCEQEQPSLHGIRP